jgi:formylglycine-generating enzyme required for sulfatase activity
MTTALIALLALPAGQVAEKIAVPGASLEVEVVKVPGGSGVPPFWMARHEVTMEAFLEYFQRRERSKADGITRPSSPYEPPNGDMGAGKHPACGMRWHGAAGYCLSLTKLTGQKFRLPTDLEWEHAARAGAKDEVLQGADAAAWFAANAGKKTQIVGAKAANAYGLHDMMGNVWEYVLEPLKPGTYDPVVRGGAWNTPAEELKFATRQPILPLWYERDPNRPRSMWWLTDARFIGFRVVRVGAAADQEAQKAYASKVTVRNVTKADPVRGFVPVTGEVVNAGNKTLLELELTVYPLTPAGKPIWEDDKARATFTLAYPVLVPAFHAGDAKTPLRPGESRKFSALVPEPFDIEEAPETYGAAVSGVRFAE